MNQCVLAEFNIISPEFTLTGYVATSCSSGSRLWGAEN